MIYLNAFLLGGIVCALFQAVHMLTKIAVPKILIGGVVLGAILAALGIMDALGAWGGAGVSVMVVGAGSAVEGATIAAMTGNWMVAGIVLSIFAALTLLGIIGGALFVATKKDEQPAGQTATVSTKG